MITAVLNTKLEKMVNTPAMPGHMDIYKRKTMTRELKAFSVTFNSITAISE